MVWAGGNDEYAVQLLIEIETDSGLTGIGECMAALNASVMWAAAQRFADMLIGQPVVNLVSLQSLLNGRWRYFPRLANYAICSLEMALWDIRGKASGLPVHAFFGEPEHTTISHFCWLHRGDSLDELLSQASQGLARGHDVFYVKVGIEETSAQVIRLVETLRDALGPSPKLRLDANQAWTLEQALHILQALGSCNLDWIEEPIADASPKNLRRIRESLDVRVAVDQSAWLAEDILRVAGDNAIDVVCTDPSRLGGLHEFVDVATSLSQFGVEICRHCGNEFGVFLAASLQACATVSNLSVGNQYCDQLSWDVIEEQLQAPSGRFPVPMQPGLGVTLDDAGIAAARDCYERALAA